MTTPDAALEYLMSEFQEQPLPEVVRRDVRLPEVPGMADALIGMRRSGKTYRLFGHMRDLVDAGIPKSSLLFLNLEDDRFGQPDLSTLDRALELFFRRTPGARDVTAYLFLDEVQAVGDWERFARRVLDTEKVRLFVTGSSARMLSTEVATQFRGRSATVEILPYSAAEAARARGLDLTGAWPPGPKRRSHYAAFFDDYLVRGGFPQVQELNEYDRVQTLQSYVELVSLRDVAERHSATNLRALRALVEAAFAANAGPFSVSKLHGSLQSQGLRVAKPTLLSYLDHLVDAYLLFLVPMRTRSARQRAVNPRKVYAVDPGVVSATARAGATDVGGRLENAVYLELRHRFGRMVDSALTYVRTSDGHEVDFAIDMPGVTAGPGLIQVCADLSDPGTRERELRSLAGAMSELSVDRGTVITLSSRETVRTDAGTVEVVPAWEWFLDPQREAPAQR